MTQQKHYPKESSLNKTLCPEIYLKTEFLSSETIIFRNRRKHYFLKPKTSDPLALNGAAPLALCLLGLCFPRTARAYGQGRVCPRCDILRLEAATNSHAIALISISWVRIATVLVLDQGLLPADQAKMHLRGQTTLLPFFSRHWQTRLLGKPLRGQQVFTVGLHGLYRHPRYSRTREPSTDLSIVLVTTSASSQPLLPRQPQLIIHLSVKTPTDLGIVDLLPPTVSDLIQHLFLLGLVLRSDTQLLWAHVEELAWHVIEWSGEVGGRHFALWMLKRGEDQRSERGLTLMPAIKDDHDGAGTSRRVKDLG